MHLFQHVDCKHTADARDILFKQHSERHKLSWNRHKASSCMLNFGAEEAKDREDDQLQFLKPEDTGTIDKKIFEVEDTVTFVTICKGTIAWGSKGFPKQCPKEHKLELSAYFSEENCTKCHKSLRNSTKCFQCTTCCILKCDACTAVYGVSICDYSENGRNEVRFKEEQFFPTSKNQLVQALDFSSSSESFQMVGVDFQGMLYLYQKKPGKEEKWMLKKPSMLPEFNPPATCINFRSAEGDGPQLVAVGSGSNEVHIYHLSSEEKNDEIEVEKVEFHHERYVDDHVEFQEGSNVIKRPDKVLDLEFVKKVSESNNGHDQQISNLELVVADASGELTVYELFNIPESASYCIDINFTTIYNLSVEAGCMVSCSDNGMYIAVGCGDRVTRVLKRLHSGCISLESKKCNGACTPDIDESENKTAEKIKKWIQEKLFQRAQEVRAKHNERKGRCVGCWRKGHHDSWEESSRFEVEQQILSVDISGNGKRVAIATEGKVAEVFDNHFGCKVNSYPSGARVRSVCLDYDGSHLLFGGYDKKVAFYNNTSGFGPYLKLTNEGNIQSVSIDSDGKRLALGLQVGGSYKAVVYDIENQKEILSAHRNKNVYVVKLSTDGKLLAIGDYSNEVVVFDVSNEKADDKALFTFDKGHGISFFVWGLDFIKTSTGYRLAVGCWNGKALIYDFECSSPKSAPKIENDFKPSFEVGREDRIFDVCLSADGKYLLVGGRDCRTALYQLENSPETAEIKEKKRTQSSSKPADDDIKPIFEVSDEERVYCVALNPKATRLAFGGITKVIKVYEKKLNDKPWGLTQKYQHGHTIHRMEFLDKEILAAVSEEGRCSIYNVTSSAPLLQLGYNDIGNSLALSKHGMLAVAHGHEVTLYGQTSCGFDIRDRPSLELAVSLMDDVESLRVALNSYPSLANVHDKDNITLLYRAVEKDKLEVVQCVLSGSCPIGLLINKETNMNALMLATQKKNKAMVAALLNAINNQRIANTSEMFWTFFAPIPKLAKEEKGSGDDNEAQKGVKSKSRDKKLISSKGCWDICCFFKKRQEYEQISGSDEVEGEKNLSVEGSHDAPSSIGGSTQIPQTMFQNIGMEFPDLLLRFLSKLELAECEDHVLGDKEYMTLQEALYVGLRCKAPQKFWQNYYEAPNAQHNFEETSHPFLVKAYRIPIPGICGNIVLNKDIAANPEQERCCGGSCMKRSKSPSEGQKVPGKTESSQLMEHSTYDDKIPSHDNQICEGDLKKADDDEEPQQETNNTNNEKDDVDDSKEADKDQESQQEINNAKDDVDPSKPRVEYEYSPLRIIVDAARSQQDFNVFKKDTVVHSLVIYKWNVLKRGFFFDYFRFLGYLFLCCWLSITLSQFLGATISELYAEALFTFPLSVFLGVCSFRYLKGEWLQLKYEYIDLLQGKEKAMPYKNFHLCKWLVAVKRYFKNDFWNFIDVFSFFTQLLTDICVWTRWETTLGFASISILLLFGKIFYFARGFNEWGPFVRMIQRTMQDMQSFLLVMLVFLLGFGLALCVLLGGHDGFENIGDSFFSVTMMIYGDFDSILEVDNGWTLATFLLEVFLIVVQIILLNLLVAIMSESFADVKENASNETVFELAKIIVELEQVNQNGMKKEQHNALFPRWVHVLKRINEDNEESEPLMTEEKWNGLESKVDKMNEQLNVLKVDIHKLHGAYSEDSDH